jgi:hypothetical protein
LRKGVLDCVLALRDRKVNDDDSGGAAGLQSALRFDHRNLILWYAKRQGDGDAFLSSSFVTTYCFSAQYKTFASQTFFKF